MIRAKLAGYVPDAVLDRVRWREGASDLSMTQNVIRFGDTPAVTLDDVIVFRERRTALSRKHGCGWARAADDGEPDRRPRPTDSYGFQRTSVAGRSFVLRKSVWICSEFR